MAGTLHSDRKFLSTPSARRATALSWSFKSSSWHFYPRPPRGGRRQLSSVPVALLLFLSTPSARRATDLYRFIADFRVISIHALREEGDDYRLVRLAKFDEFLSTPSARRATSYALIGALPLSDFYPRPPRGGRPNAIADVLLCLDISIHALREEGDTRGGKFYPIYD